jgi:hypothetical protein
MKLFVHRRSEGESHGFHSNERKERERNEPAEDY